MESKVTFLIPVYNKAPYIAETIHSLQAQTLKDIEILFIDDGSTDGTTDVIEFFQKTDDRIKLHRLKENVGLGKAWNIGTALVKSPVICVGSGDDVWVPERAKLSYNALKGGKDVFYGAFYFCDDRLHQMEYKPAIPFSAKKMLTPREDGFCPQYIGHFVMAYTTKIAKKVPYRSGLRVGIDYPFLVDLVKAKAKFTWTKKVLGSARILASGVSISRREEVVNASQV